jgi:hypothetical protein
VALYVRFPPYKNSVPDVSCPVNPVHVTDLAMAVPRIATVLPPEFASKNTSSDDVGTAAPPAPPDVVDHLVPAVPSQFAAPPTQYLFAMRYTCVVTATTSQRVLFALYTHPT